MTRAPEAELRLELLDIVHRLTRAEAFLLDRDIDAAVEAIAAARQTAQRLADELLARAETAAPSAPPAPESAPTDDPAIDVVREVQESFDPSEPPGHPLLHERYAWDMRNFSGWPERTVYEGPGGFREMYRDWESIWEDLDSRFEERFMGADGRVVTFIRKSARPRAGGPRAEMTYAVVSTVENGLLLRDEAYDSWSAALRAVGGARRQQP